MTAVFTLLMYAAVLVLVIGLVLRILRYARTPVPLKIPTTPAPITAGGVAWRMTKEVVLFESLFKSSKWTWLFGWVFHAALLVLFVGHLRYVLEPVPAVCILAQNVALYAAIALLAALAGLWIRRVAVDRVRYISAPSDHLMLALLVAIGATGVLMRTVDPVDVVGLKLFTLGLLRFDFHPLPADPLIVVHLGLVALLMVVFPFSKLLHAPGVFFSPTRNQRDNPRELRHVTSWAEPLATEARNDG